MSLTESLLLSVGSITCSMITDILNSFSDTAQHVAHCVSNYSNILCNNFHIRVAGSMLAYVCDPALSRYTTWGTQLSKCTVYIKFITMLP